MFGYKSFALFFIIFCWLCSNAQTQYLSYLNEFKPYHYQYSKMVERNLECENPTKSNIISLIDTIGSSKSAYDFTIRWKNIQVKSSDIINIVFNYSNKEDYYVASLQKKHQYANENPSLTLNVKHHTINGASSVCSINIDDEYNEKLYYALKIESNLNQTNFYLGTTKFKHICSVSNIKHAPKTQVGLLYTPSLKIAVERIIIRKEAISNIEESNWTNELFEEKFKSSSDEIEGYWSYLDRDLDESKLKIGGKYKLAIVKCSDGYDIFYIDGGVVNSDEWQLGMKKGELKHSALPNNYDLIWYDSNFKPIHKDAFASIDENLILTIQLPTYKSSLRFIRLKK